MTLTTDQEDAADCERYRVLPVCPSYSVSSLKKAVPLTSGTV